MFPLVLGLRRRRVVRLGDGGQIADPAVVIVVRVPVGLLLAAVVLIGE
ncbi:hypothetical protein ACVGOW_33280 [Pseudonocardia saturnea]